MSKRHAVALVALAGGKWHVSFHNSLDEANDYGATRVKDLEDGFSVETEEHFKEIPDQFMPGLHDFLVKKPCKFPTDTDEARAKVWALLSASLVAGEEPATDEPATETESGAEPEVEPEEEPVNTQTETAAPARARGRAAPKAVKAAPKAPAKTPAKATVRAAPKAAPKAVASTASAAKALAKATGRAAPKTIAKGAAKVGAVKTLSEPWKKVFKAIHKKGDDGMVVTDMAQACEAAGVGCYYRRFETAGLLKRVTRGSYALTGAGVKAAGLND